MSSLSLSWPSSLFLLEIVLDKGAVKVDPGAATKDVQNVFACGFKVRSRIVRFGDEELRFVAVVTRLENVTDLEEFLLHRTE